MSDDWLTDDNMSEAETMARFRSLPTEPTRGPLPGGGQFMQPVPTRNVVDNISPARFAPFAVRAVISSDEGFVAVQ